MNYPEFINNLISLFYPDYCHACGTSLSHSENILCIECNYNLPKVDYSDTVNNPVNQLFWGKVEIEHAFAYFNFFKGSKYRQMMHNFKYRGYKEIGFHLGKQFGEDIKRFNINTLVDTIIPVPLHPKKERIRGFNQSHYGAATPSIAAHDQFQYAQSRDATGADAVLRE